MLALKRSLKVIQRKKILTTSTQHKNQPAAIGTPENTNPAIDFRTLPKTRLDNTNPSQKGMPKLSLKTK